VEKDGGGIWSGSGAREEREIAGNTNFDGGGDSRARRRRFGSGEIGKKKEKRPRDTPGRGL